MDFLRNYFIVLLILFVSVFHIKFTLGVADSSKLHANFDFQPYKVMDLAQQFHMHCNITDQTLANSKPEYKWYKDNELLKTTNKDGKPYLEVSGKNLRILKPSLDDIGNYWCHVYVNGTEQSKIMIEVIVKPYVKLTSQLTFIEGEELKIECAIQAKPTPAVMWKFEEIEYRESRDRVELRTSSAGIPNAMFVIKNTEKSDRGNYTCLAINTEPQVGITDQVTGSSVSYVRIKDKFAALWPFLGICVEVIVLCAIIFVYEKKRNKAELEESDTDQSPEQTAYVIAEEFSRGFVIIPLRESTEDLTRVLMFYPDQDKVKEDSCDSKRSSRNFSFSETSDKIEEKAIRSKISLVERDTDLEVEDEPTSPIHQMLKRKSKKLLEFSNPDHDAKSDQSTVNVVSLSEHSLRKSVSIDEKENEDIKDNDEDSVN